MEAAVRALLRGIATLGMAWGAAAPALAELPAVARPGLAGGAEPRDAPDLVFFLAIGAPPGATAIGTAHTFPLARPAEAQRVEFFLAGPGRHVASSQRFLVPPGRPFNLPGATLHGDCLVYALERAPRGVRILEVAAPPRPELGMRVRIPGAPICAARNGRVVGILEAHVAEGRGARAGRARAGGRARAAPALLSQRQGEPMRVHLRIDLPADGSIAADSRCGVFVTGRAHALRGELQRYDVVLVLDTSRSTIDPAGADINGNGVVGRKRLGHLGAIFGADSSDPGDSILAAEVAAARQLLGLSGAISRTDPEAEKIVFFFTDGQPTLPHEGVGAEANNVRAVLRGAAVCAPTHSQSAPSARRPDRHGGDGEPYQWPLHPAVPSRGSRGSHARGELREHRRDGALERHHR